MNKPLKNSEWKSNRASSYYWITSSWKPEAGLSSGSARNLHCSSWCRAVPVGGHRFLLECQFHCDYPPHGPMWAILLPGTQKPWLGHFSNLLTLQGNWHPPEDTRDTDKPRGEGQGKMSNPSEERRSGELMRPEALACLLFSEIENVISCSVLTVILGGVFPQGHRVFCATSWQSTLLGVASGFRASKW